MNSAWIKSTFTKNGYSLMAPGRRPSVIDDASEGALVLGGVRPICPQAAHDKSMNTFSSDMEEESE